MLRAHKGGMWVCLFLNAIFRNKDDYHTDVNIICHAKNVIKYVGINIFRQ